MRQRKPPPARLTHVATIGDIAPPDRSLRTRALAIVAITGIILAGFFAAKHWTSRILAAQWTRSLDTVADDQAEMLVGSAARLGRPGLPVLVAALGSPRESVSSAGRLWLDRELRSWENLANQEAQRNVAALAETLASKLDELEPAARLDAARLANRLLRWQLDGEVVDRGRVTWLCDRILRAANYTADDPGLAENHTVSAETGDQQESTKEAAILEEDLFAPRPLEIPELLQVAQTRRPFAPHANQVKSPNIVPLPDVANNARRPDLADAWTMRGRALRPDSPDTSEMKIYPGTGERVLVPASPDGEAASPQPVIPLRDRSLVECMKLLHSPGFESLAAESELKRRGFDPVRLSIARRVYDPDRRVRLQLVRDLPGIPGVGATDWLIMMAEDEHEEVRLAAISLLATTGDPAILARVESIARDDPSTQIRAQAERLAKRRQTLNR